MNTQQQALPIPDSKEWCSLQYAGAKLGRNERTIRRWIASGKLTAYSPRVAHCEEPHTLLWVVEVEQLNAAMRTLKLRTPAKAAR